MKIISHRGFWINESEKNTIEAFERSFSQGYGTETDIRDYKGELVISHDIADDSSLSLDDFFSLYNSINPSLPLALNIKADGLQVKLKNSIEKHKITSYFVFDMSVPDGLSYLKHGLNTFTRQSEYEMAPSFYLEANGIWLDEFYKHWITQNVILDHLQNNKQVCIVSPDLHHREYTNEWNDYKEIIKCTTSENIILCTDFPNKAKSFFYE